MDVASAVTSFELIRLVTLKFVHGIQCDQKKSPKVYKNCLKMISLKK